MILGIFVNSRFFSPKEKNFILHPLKYPYICIWVLIILILDYFIRF